MAEFFAMGGYAKYVWSAYSISMVVLVITVLLTRRALRGTKERILRRQASQQELST